MGDLVRSTIEKIKLQEQDEESKIREKREQDASISALNKTICDATAQAKESQKEQKKLIKNIDLLRRQELLEKTRHDALSAQLEALKKELKELRAKSNEDISKLWEMRSAFCNEIYSTSEDCDVWALLMKPTFSKSTSTVSQNEQQNNPQSSNINTEVENRLQKAIERRTKAMAERNRLAAEPDNLEEFVRLKNAVRYTLEKIAQLRDYKNM